MEVGDDNDEDEDGVVGVSDDDTDVENAEDGDNPFLSSPSYFLKHTYCTYTIYTPSILGL